MQKRLLEQAAASGITRVNVDETANKTHPIPARTQAAAVETSKKPRTTETVETAKAEVQRAAAAMKDTAGTINDEESLNPSLSIQTHDLSAKPCEAFSLAKTAHSHAVLAAGMADKLITDHPQVATELARTSIAVARVAEETAQTATAALHTVMNQLPQAMIKKAREAKVTSAMAAHALVTAERSLRKVSKVCANMPETMRQEILKAASDAFNAAVEAQDSGQQASEGARTMTAPSAHFVKQQRHSQLLKLQQPATGSVDSVESKSQFPV